ncbi:vitamin H transporter [Aspergillus steynii IBT 23096]|uniref:Vitamin H transporter n=1 Tax=Aspergillus steynii IBT 23096 TaxID=1392250 RepID=A0A2I2G3N1_9EURO|nr:vitamin H transporter [Aspergillus steynii IBT 23096]PLB47483.1 vitamin H transporter [Aspergillus steynii IBT 23096]
MLIAKSKGDLEDPKYPRSPSPSSTWSATDERQARRKIDFSVLPLLFLGMTVFQLDRMNVASALTGGFGDDINVNQNTINLGNQLMFLGIIVLEIPSNILLQRIGPEKWMPTQVLLFGIIAIFQVFLKNRTGFLVIRALLGLTEAGYIPGSVYTLSTWYVGPELAKRVAILFFGMFGGNAISPLLGAGILRLDGRHGLKGWQWIFLVEGLMTIGSAILLVVFLPRSPDRPRPFLVKRGLIAFSDHDRETLLNYRRWPHFISTACVFSTWSPLTTYTPSIVMALGFNRIQANALSAIGAFMTLPLVFFFAWLSDKTARRGLVVITAISCYLIVLIVARAVLPSVGKWNRFGIWTVVNAFAVGYHPIHNTWVQVNCRDAGERSISIAMWVMSAIAGLMAGTQIFRANDAPDYLRGLVIMIALVASGLVLASTQEVVYLFLNRRARKQGEEAIYVP